MTFVPKIAERAGDRLRRLGRNEWPAQWSSRTLRCPPRAAWLSRDFLVQEFDEAGRIRLSIVRTAYDPTADRFVDGISWDELQRIKTEIGYRDRWAVECYPPDDLLIDVANMRHLWLLPVPPTDFSWT